VLLPIKFLDSEREPVAAILSLTLAAKLPLEQAKSMAKLLLDLGATSSHADLNGCTAFHRVVEVQGSEMVDVLVEHDPAGVRTAINHMVVSPSQWNLTYAPIHSAVAKGDLGLVIKLINAGAMVDIDFETWLQAVRVSPQAAPARSSEASKKMYGMTVISPLMIALSGSVDVDLAITLLEQGADPNAMTSASQTALQGYTWRVGGTVLDRVRDILGQLRGFKGPNYVAKPSLRPGMDECLAQYVEGTYMHWTVSLCIAGEKERYEDEMKLHRKSVSGRNLENDVAAKFEAAAVRDRIPALEKLEAMLLSKGAKTFAELHPEVVEKHPSLYNKARNGDAKDTEVKPYQFKVCISYVSDLTDARKDAYVEL
jgi:hypothetical protein